jgi:outer membrane protein OmpA-like peptidoglycan-associated protein
MKKHILILFLIIPFIGFSQNVKWIDKEKFDFQFKVGTVYDHYSENNDNHSPDLSSNYENDYRLNTSAALYYNVNPNFSLGLEIGHGKIYGENDLLFYEGDFEELNFNAKLNFLKYKKIEVYGRLSTGVIRYQSQRDFLNKGDIPLSQVDGEALKSNLALGFEYRFKKQWSVLFDASFNRVDNDNFDAFDDGIGNSKYLVTSIGLKYDFVAKSKAKKEKDIDHKKEIKRRVKANHEANVEPRLKELENLISSHSHQINKEELIIDSKNSPKLNHNFFFETNKHLLSINSLDRIIEIADFMKENSDYKAKVTGYADSDASNLINEALSKERAENIKQYLISLGINEDRVSTFYEGESSPLAPNNSDLNKQLNRRVYLELVK